MDLTVIRLTVAIAVVMFSLLAFDYAVLAFSSATSERSDQWHSNTHCTG